MSRLILLCMAAMMVSGADHPVEGNPNSPVRVIAYGSLQCGDCTVYRRMMDEHLLAKYGEKHKWARPAAIAARHFDRVRPSLGVQFRRWVMNNIRDITAESFNDKLGEWARAHGADGDKAVAALDDASLVKAVEEDFQDGVARGVARTPTVFVNGEPFIERFTVEEISKAIDAALAATKTTR
jgi:protein-disulfide isomerase